MSAIYLIPDNPVLLRFKEELNKNPANVERKKKLYYVAAIVSGIVGAALCILSFLVFQTTPVPFWLGLIGPFVIQMTGYLFLTTASKIMQNAQETGLLASRLKEIQNIYICYQDTELTENVKTIIPHCLSAKKEYIETEQRLEELKQITSSSNLESNLEEIIFLNHQVLLLKIDLAFKVAILDITFTNNLNCVIEQEDLLKISDQYPLILNRIQGLNDIVLNELIEPLISFKTFDRGVKDLSYVEVEKMSVHKLKEHILTAMETPLLQSQFNPLNN